MLLQSTIDFITSVRMKMLFDNSKEKVVILEKDQYILIKFRHNGGKYRRLGKVKAIVPVIETMLAHHCGQTDSLFSGCKIVVDFGAVFGSCQLTINCNEILDLRVLTEDKVKELLALGDDLVITDDMFDEDNDIIPDEPDSGDGSQEGDGIEDGSTDVGEGEDVQDPNADSETDVSDETSTGTQEPGTDGGELTDDEEVVSEGEQV